MTAAVPAFAALGFEARLDETEAPELDLQFGASAGRELRVLSDALRRVEESDGLPRIWEPVAALCRDSQQQGSAIHQGMAEMWCELDLQPGAEVIDLSTVLPSVFAVLNRLEPAERLATVDRVLQRLTSPEEAAHLGAAVDRCEAAASPGGWVSHVGVMLGRPVHAMRVHVSGVPLWRMGDFLDAVGWPGDSDRAVALAGELLDLCDWMVLCFDVVGEMLPRLGLEGGFNQRWGLDLRWPALLERLEALGLCGAGKRQALLDWPGVIGPTASDGWPDPLIAAGISAPDHTIDVVERRLSHVKLSFDHAAGPSAKAYFGAGHVLHDLRPRARAGSTVAALRPAATVEEAIDGAIGFLLGQRGQAGWWMDFSPLAISAGTVEEALPTTRSDEWVTAYVATALARSDDPRAREAAEHALRILWARRPAGGWGYSLFAPADADSTAWVLWLARGLDQADTPRLRDAYAFLARQIDADGAVATYRGAAVPVLTFWTGGSGPHHGWRAKHGCVTAVVAGLDLEPRPREHLCRTQNHDGSWAAYWWHDHEYATAHAVVALAAHRGRERVERAMRWVEGRIEPDGSVVSTAHGGPSPFAAALALTALSAGGRPTSGARGRVLSWLLSQQRTDGSWEPSARLRIPAPEQSDPTVDPQTASNDLDDRALFTTATVLSALTQA